MLIKLDKANKTFGLKTVFDDLTLIVNRGDRAGLIGDNGSGKSTILRACAGLIPLTNGDRQLAPEVTIGYLPQSLSDSYYELTVADVISQARSTLSRIEEEMRLLEGAMGQASEAELDAILTQYAGTSALYEEAGGYTFDQRREEVFQRLNLTTFAPERPIGSLSGGEQTRLALGSVLLANPTVLLLDEPTNNLDFTQLDWLQTYLSNFNGGVVVATHDRDFLDAVCNVIYVRELGDLGLAKFRGTYNEYAVALQLETDARKAEAQLQDEAVAELKRYLSTTGRAVGHNRPARDNDKFSQHFHRQRVDRTVSRNVRGAEQRLLRIERNRVIPPPDPIEIHTPFVSRHASAAPIVRLLGVHCELGGQTILEDVDFDLAGQDRIGLVGPNGSGKTTFLRLLVGELAPDRGSVLRHRSKSIGYLAQEPAFARDRTPLQIMGQGSSTEDSEERKGAWLPVRLGLLTRQDMDIPVGDLSLGQRRRLDIARLAAREVDALVLDEPTNHVSPEVTESLQESVRRYPGPVVVASHDRRFLREIGATLLTIDHGKLMAMGELPAR